MAKWLRGTPNWYLAPRVPGPNADLWRVAPAASSCFVYGVLQSGAHALGIAEGCTPASSGSTDWSHCRHSDVGRIASSIRPNMIFGKDRAASSICPDLIFGKDSPSTFHSPWQNGYVERLIGSIRCECTDHLIVLNAEHLRRNPAKYVAYYNDVRTHVSLGKAAPYTRAIERFGNVVAYPILGGLHHRYVRI
jgi:hypothetical protein